MGKKKSTTDNIADAIKTSKRTIEDTYRIQKKRPDLLDLILAGKITVDEAKEVIRNSSKNLSIPSDDPGRAADQIMGYIEKEVVDIEFVRTMCRKILAIIG
jgi:hypothetical protein